MEEVGQLHSSTKVIFIAFTLLIVGCARTAPKLPTTNGGAGATLSHTIKSIPPEIQKMNCAEINDDFERLAQHDDHLEQRIHAHRTQNQVASFLTGFILTPIMAEQDEATKALLDQNQNHRDQLIVAMQIKRCATTN